MPKLLIRMTLAKSLKIGLCFACFLASTSGQSQEIIKYNSIYFYEKQFGKDTEFLDLAEKFSNSGDYKDRESAEWIFRAILTNNTRSATLEQRKIAKEKISEKYSWDCNFEGSCKPIVRPYVPDFDPSKISNPYFEPEKWGFTLNQLNNKDIGILLGDIKAKYRVAELLKAAQEGDIAAMIVFAHHSQINGNYSNSSELFKKFIRAAADFKNPYAMGTYAFDSENFSLAEKAEIFRNAADLGDPRSMLVLSVSAFTKSESEQLELKRRAAALGYVAASNDLGRYYEDRRNFDEAFKWFKKAFDDRVDIAPLPYIGFMFLNDVPLPGEEKKFEWQEKIAKSDSTMLEYKILFAKKMNSISDEEKLSIQQDYIKLAAFGGYGSVLAAEDFSIWYNGSCKPSGPMSYKCKLQD